MLQLKVNKAYPTLRIAPIKGAGIAAVARADSTNHCKFET